MGALMETGAELWAKGQTAGSIPLEFVFHKKSAAMKLITRQFRTIQLQLDPALTKTISMTLGCVITLAQQSHVKPSKLLSPLLQL